MDNYLTRLASFFSFPFSSPVSTTSLAEAGFHYTGHKDEVECHRCLLSYSGWQKQDDPMAVHMTMSPQCIFVSKTNDIMCNGNVADGAVGGISDYAIFKNEASIQDQQTDKQLATASCQDIDDSLFATRNEDYTDKSISSNLRPTTDNMTPSTDQVKIKERPEAELNVVSQNITGDSNGHINAQSREQINTSEIDSLLPEIQRLGEDFPNTVKSGHVPFNGLETERGIPFETSQTLNAVKPRYSQFQILAVRLASYKYWPKHLNQKPEDLAKAGLFYEGTNDYVRCFHCAGGLREWEPEDDPFIEHARWFPFCEFMRLTKGDEFIMGVQTGSIKAAPQKQAETPKVPEMEYSFNDPAILSVMEMGYSKETIAKAIKLFRKRKGHALSAEILLSLVFEMEEDDGVASDEEEQGSRANEKIPDESHCEVMKGKDIPVSNDIPPVSSDIPISERSIEEVLQLQEENQSLRDRKTCKVCLDEEASIVFLPCGHLVTCPMCASALRKCPICRSFIRGTVKAIVS